MNVCALIPARNEAETIGEVVRRCRPYCTMVVVINDGSQDATATIAADAGAVVLSLRHPHGKGYALRQGFRFALNHECDAVVTLDGDGQHDPDEIPRFVRCSESRHEPLVTGCRMGNAREMPRLRWFTNRVTSISLSWGFGYELRDTQCGYRLIRRDLLRRLNLRTSKYDIETEVLVEANALGIRAAEIPIRCVHRDRGATHGYRDIIRFLYAAGRRHSCLQGFFHLIRTALHHSTPSLVKGFKAAALPVSVAVALLTAFLLGGGRWPTEQGVRASLDQLGFVAPLLYILLCTIKPLTFVPFSGLTVVAGAAFGLWMGTLWTAIGGLTGACVGFHMARFYGRKPVQQFLQRRWPKAQRQLENTRWSTVFTAHMLNIPWDWVSYAAGLSAISFRGFILGAAAAVLPVAFLGVWLGSSLWSFPSPRFFLAFGTLFTFGTLTFLLRRRQKGRMTPHDPVAVPRPELVAGSRV